MLPEWAHKAGGIQCLGVVLLLGGPLTRKMKQWLTYMPAQSPAIQSKCPLCTVLTPQYGCSKLPQLQLRLEY